MRAPRSGRTEIPDQRPDAWLGSALLFALASFVETLGFGHLGAFTPLYLAQFGVPESQVPQWTGLLTAVSFVLGLPLAPFWGVWADRYSRKLIILRSTVGEGIIFFLFGIAAAPWQLVPARVLVGFILGNTGVMYAVLADAAPRRHVATAIAFITAGSTLGVSVGPFIGGWLIPQIGIARLYQADGIVCWTVALLLAIGLHEHAQGPRSTASTGALLRALPGNLRASPIVLPLFGLYFVALLGMNMPGPFVPLLVSETYRGPDLPLAIGAVLLTAGLVSAGSGPILSRLGRAERSWRVLAAALVGGSVAALAQARSPDYVALLVARGAMGAVQGGLSPLIVSVIALATPSDRRASVLNLTLFPSNLSFLFGGVVGSVIAAISVRAVFVASAAVLLLGAALTAIVSRTAAAVSRAGE